MDKQVYSPLNKDFKTPDYDSVRGAEHFTIKQNNQMNTEATLEQLRALRLQGMARSYKAVLSLFVCKAN